MRTKKLSTNAICFILSGVLALSMPLFNVIKASAEDNLIKSKGVISYQSEEGSVLIDSQDFVELNNYLLQLKAKLHID